MGKKYTNLFPSFERGHLVLHLTFFLCCVAKSTGKKNQFDLVLVPILPQYSCVSLYKPPTLTLGFLI